MMSTYFKCDSTANAFRLLNMMHRRDLITWNMFLDGCARYGLGIEAVRAYEEMIAEGVAPDQRTFMGLLCACSHECMIEEGCRDERHEEREETYWSLGELYEHLRSSDYMLETEFVMDVLEEEDFIGERLPWLLTSTDIARGAIQSGQRL
ncbi:hypothetical protein AMTR_s00155p00016930 [Amborella trichopoda]|uniref:Pentacotripeptide-repeat region of PRORP domain-containing protein n=1 Tax=Amborella trichopoda TaxID=13333 RepID=W1PJ22_AMBTC|nr:hypothetical protein AMTR_s00155p00016930 [Amborella trichopoda]